MYVHIHVDLIWLSFFYFINNLCAWCSAIKQHYKLFRMYMDVCKRELWKKATIWCCMSICLNLKWALVELRWMSWEAGWRCKLRRILKEFLKKNLNFFKKIRNFLKTEKVKKKSEKLKNFRQTVNLSQSSAPFKIPANQTSSKLLMCNAKCGFFEHKSNVNYYKLLCEFYSSFHSPIS